MRASGEELLQKIQVEFAASGVFCASKRFNNYLLWAHYAQGHQGAVLEFVPNAEKDSMLILAEEVVYSDERPHLYYSHRDFLIKSMFRQTEDVLGEYTKNITKNKSVEWAYEEEIRLYMPGLVNIFEGKRNHCLTYHPDELRAVYLGCRMDRATRERIVDLATNRNPSVEVYEMVPDPHKYQLTAQTLEPR